MSQFEVSRDGTTLVGSETGSGPVVLFLHGGPGLSDYSLLLRDEFEHRRVISYTQRGPSPSSSHGPFNIETHVQDAVLVVEHLALNEVVTIVGHSWGGHLAMHLAIQNRINIAGLLLIEPFGAIGDGGELAISEEMTRRLPPQLAAEANRLDAKALLGEGTEEDGVESMRLFWPAYSYNWQNGHAMPPGMRLSVDSYHQSMTSMREHLFLRTLANGLPSFDKPTTLLAGMGSPLGQQTIAETASVIPNAVTDVVPLAGHFPWIEVPGCVTNALAALDARQM